jgi:hypothetical protein
MCRETAQGIQSTFGSAFFSAEQPNNDGHSEPTEDQNNGQSNQLISNYNKHHGLVLDTLIVVQPVDNFCFLNMCFCYQFYKTRTKIQTPASQQRSD